MNNLYLNRFKLSIPAAPIVSELAQNANIPAMSAMTAEIETPHLRINRSTSKIEYDEFTVTFQVDEEMKSYLEIYKWMRHLSNPEDFQDDQLLEPGRVNLYSENDGNLILLNNSMNPYMEVSFQGLRPISLSDIQFDATDSSTEIVTCTVSFRYDKFDIRGI